MASWESGRALGRLRGVSDLEHSPFKNYHNVYRTKQFFASYWLSAVSFLLLTDLVQLYHPIGASLNKLYDNNRETFFVIKVLRDANKMLTVCFEPKS